jgi:hypothetical protein
LVHQLHVGGGIACSYAMIVRRSMICTWSLVTMKQHDFKLSLVTIITWTSIWSPCRLSQCSNAGLRENNGLQHSFIEL